MLAQLIIVVPDFFFYLGFKNYYNNEFILKSFIDHQKVNISKITLMYLLYYWHHMVRSCCHITCYYFFKVNNHLLC